MVKISPSNAGGESLTPHWEIKIPPCFMAKIPEHKQQKQYGNRFNKDLKNDPYQKKKKGLLKKELTS